MNDKNIQIDFNFSRPIDFQKNIDSIEFNKFYKSLLISSSDKLLEKHLKLIIIELIFCWFESKDQFLTVSMSKRGYRAKSRYNPNMISSCLIQAVKKIKDKKLLELFPGFFDLKRNISRLTRIRASEDLVSKFTKYNFNHIEFLNLKNRETILLSDSHKNLIEYEDNFSTHEMREVLNHHNILMTKTFFDIACVENNFILRGDATKILISFFSNFDSRIFTNNWSDGGHFFGSWWHRLDMKSINEFSQHMLINDQKTSFVNLSRLFSLYFSKYFYIDQNEIEFDLIYKNSNLIRNIDHLNHLIIKAVGSQNINGLFRSFCNDKRKLGIEEKIKITEFQKLLSLLKRRKKLYSLFFKKNEFNWDSIISNIFYQLIKNIGTANIPIIKVKDRIFFQSKFEKNIIDFLSNFVSKDLSSEKFQLKSQNCFSYNNTGFFDKFRTNKLNYSKRFLENKKNFDKIQKSK